jgi:SNF2 family DNA or RNA helicase
MNWQNCNHIVYFPSHSYEQYYQAVRRCWRFGQKKPVTVDIVLTEGERKIMKNLQRKNLAAIKMFDNLVKEMNNVLHINKTVKFTKQEVLPSWL